MTRPGATFQWASLLLLAAIDRAAAQESITATDSATQPSPGHVILKEQFRFYRLDLDTGPRARRGEVDESVFLTTLNAGVSADVSLSFRMPVRLRDREFDFLREAERDEGIGDFTALAKWRVYRKDDGPLDTARLSLIGGAEIRTGDSPFTNDAYNPILGLAYTQIAGRHGVNASLNWTFTTGGNDEPIFAGESTADLFRYDLAYLWRLAPREYTAETRGAWYLVAEVNGLYETNGDHELLVSPGIMYEARTWTAELSVQLPAWQEIDHRAETEFVLIAGVRFSW
jgi:hypothetical protein